MLFTYTKYELFFKVEMFLFSCSSCLMSLKPSLTASPNCHPKGLWTRKKSESSRTRSFIGIIKQEFSLVPKYLNNPSKKRGGIINLTWALLLSSSHSGTTSSTTENNLCLKQIQKEVKGNEHFLNTFAPDSTSDTSYVFHFKVTKTLQRVYKYFC